MVQAQRTSSIECIRTRHPVLTLCSMPVHRTVTFSLSLQHLSPWAAHRSLSDAAEVRVLTSLSLSPALFRSLSPSRSRSLSLELSLSLPQALSLSPSLPPRLSLALSPPLAHRALPPRLSLALSPPLAHRALPPRLSLALSPPLAHRVPRSLSPYSTLTWGGSVRLRGGGGLGRSCAWPVQQLTVAGGLHGGGGLGRSCAWPVRAASSTSSWRPLTKTIIALLGLAVAALGLLWAVWDSRWLVSKRLAQALPRQVMPRVPILPCPTSSYPHASQLPHPTGLCE